MAERLAGNHRDGSITRRRSGLARPSFPGLGCTAASSGAERAAAAVFLLLSSLLRSPLCHRLPVTER